MILTSKCFNMKVGLVLKVGLFIYRGWAKGEQRDHSYQPGVSQVARSPLCRPSINAACRSLDDPWVHDSGEM